MSAASAAILSSATVMNEDALRLIYLNLPLKELLNKCSVSKMTARFCVNEGFWKEYIEKNYFYGQVENVFLEKARSYRSTYSFSELSSLEVEIATVPHDELVPLVALPNSIAAGKSYKTIAIEIQKLLDLFKKENTVISVKTFLILLHLTNYNTFVRVFLGDSLDSFLKIQHITSALQIYRFDNTPDYVLYDKIIFRDDNLEDINKLIVRIDGEDSWVVPNENLFKMLKNILNYINTPTLYWVGGKIKETNFNVDKIDSYLDRFNNLAMFSGEVVVLFDYLLRIISSYEMISLTNLLFD